MKIKFKKRRTLFELYKDWRQAHGEKLKAKYNRRWDEIESWQERFAWFPVRLTTDDMTVQYALFEKYYEKGIAYEVGHWLWTGLDVPKSRSWERHSAKDFFKKKLKGEIEDEGQAVDQPDPATSPGSPLSEPPPTTYVKTSNIVPRWNAYKDDYFFADSAEKEMLRLLRENCRRIEEDEARLKDDDSSKWG